VIITLHPKDTAVLQNNTILKEVIVVKAAAGTARMDLTKKETAKTKIYESK
jgi:hypothetical protein